ncbi:hypothetical protein D1632_10650 [Chryseobacterium nematophagum]|uniref:DUF3820 family protein n=1 Tax=Chryseobacterium nematophagum TaxID=2305228 RepID=A0A3M7LEX5_9FLAO|nr:DUF3820 family protein [Chryseobacterium nematophagum]RMZ60042.1 hypothetical protein D1632_10650 [Chryseobacterium nematophagum]
MEDTDIMPYGLHKGKQMQDVPAEYLLWLYEEEKCTGPVKEYIKDNLQVLEIEIERNEKTI